MKFPLILSQGVEGIAVGLSTKIMPHNFIELLKASIKVLQDKRVKLYPDFLTGGMVDVSDYQGGKRGGKIRVRARIEQKDKKHLIVKELPYGVTTTSLMDSIIKANDKGKIKIKKIVDNTAKDVEVLIELAPGISPDVTMDALYAFTHCEVSISPNACVIIDNKPHFVTVEELLRTSTLRTKELLRLELEIRKGELEEKWHFASLEKIFIENRIYRDIEECETWEAVIEAIDKGLQKYVATPSTKQPKDKRLLLYRDITFEDITRLTEIKIKRISKYNSFKADELIKGIEEELEQVKFDLAHLTDFAIAYFNRLIEKYGAGKERRTEIKEFDTIRATRVIANNARLYANYKEGFIGTGLKKDVFVSDCSDIDNIISFRKDGVFVVNLIADKVFVGKNMIHTHVWKKGDDRTTYNLIYVDGKTGRSMAKRFNVKSITRDKEYHLTTGEKGSKILYFSANPNGESEIVEIQLTPGCKAKKKVFQFDFSEIAIKGRSSKGNIVTRYPVRKIQLIEVGKSTLGAIKVWMDDVSGRLNKEERGTFLGAFDTGDLILAIYMDGTYELSELDINKKFEPTQLVFISKLETDSVISAVYFEGEKGWTMVKRFQIETRSTGQRFKFITDHKSSKLYFATADNNPKVKYGIRRKNRKEEETLEFNTFIDVKGWKALGNKLTEYKLISIEEIEAEKKHETVAPTRVEDSPEDPGIGLFAKEANNISDPPAPEPKPNQEKDHLSTGDTIEFDI
jgi:topoisomerase-4 subunit A